MNATVLFLKTNEHTGNDLQNNTDYSTQGTYLELHTGYPYENSDRCNPTDSTVPVKVFTVRNLRDIRTSDIYKQYIDKSFKGCPITVIEKENPFTKYFTTPYQPNDIRERNVEMLSVIEKALNISLRMVNLENRNGKPIDNSFIFFVPIIQFFYGTNPIIEYTRSYLSVCSLWYTPCAVKYIR
jgi:hypothetical protein